MRDTVELVINIDARCDPETLHLAMKAVNGWSHGIATIRRRIKQGGLMNAVVECWYPASDDEYALILEDDIELSPLYYVWLKWTLLKYRYGTENYPQLFGISLYTPRVHELPMPKRRFKADK